MKSILAGAAAGLGYAVLVVGGILWVVILTTPYTLDWRW